MNTVGQRAFVALGGNVGAVLATFDSALAALDRTPGLRLTRCSRRYRTPPWGPVPQPAYLNAVAEFSSNLDPMALLDVLLACEALHGRRRGDETRWGPRTLDLDLLALGATTLDHPRLTLPHPRLATRGFVLLPWAEIAADWAIPGHGTVGECVLRVDCTGIEALPYPPESAGSP